MGLFTSVESTCWRLTPLLYIFFRSSERRPLARPEHRGQSSRLLLRQVVRVFHSQGPGPCIWCIIPVSFWGHVFHFVFHTLRCTYVSPVLFDPCVGTTLEVYFQLQSEYFMLSDLYHFGRLIYMMMTYFSPYITLIVSMMIYLLYSVVDHSDEYILTCLTCHRWDSWTSLWPMVGIWRV